MRSLQAGKPQLSLLVYRHASEDLVDRVPITPGSNLHVHMDYYFMDCHDTTPPNRFLGKLASNIKEYPELKRV